ncbi:MAG: Gfo/Idh/MocA family oxidoreductase [Chloroflexi bacterium]|nr:Gfo/Idh/MocA family oxidoreductase [Chloroflexota bacterium]
MQKTIRWGILGTGGIAQDFVQGVQVVPDAVIGAVGSRTQAKADSFAQQFGIAKAYSSYEALVNDPDLDVIYIGTPNHIHKENCLLALGAGKAVLCEKPFAMNAAEAREVVAFAREKKLFCMEAMWMRFMPIMPKLRSMLADGVIGDICMLLADFGGRPPFDPSNRFYNAEMGGGAMLDLGVYPLSLAYFLLGQPSQIVSQAIIGKTGVDEQVVTILKYPAGNQAVVTTSFLSTFPTDALIVGSKGQIRIQNPMYAPRQLVLTMFGGDHHSSGAARSGLVAAAKQNRYIRAAYSRSKGLIKRFLPTDGKSITVPVTGNGYNYEAIEVMNCLRASQIESKIMPLDETIQIMEALDTIRQQWQSEGA